MNEFEVEQKSKFITTDNAKTIKKCCSIASHYNHSTNTKEKLTKLQNENERPNHSIIQQVPTRWNSIYLMVDRIVENFEFLNIIFANEPKFKHLQLKSEEIEVLEASLEVLRPFYDMTCEVSSEKDATLSLIIPIITKLNKSIEPNSEMKL
ncbi:unnamed protein product, partial [Brachionus calyciflorus]